jgi:hypothetical protein
MCIPTPRSLALGGLVCCALLAAGCADQAPPLEPTAAGALLAGQGQGPQNPEVVVIDIDDQWVWEGACAGYGGLADGLDLELTSEGRIRVMLHRHPVSGALREIGIWQGLDITVSGNDRTARSNQAGPVFIEYDMQGSPTQVRIIGLNVAIVAPGWGVILLDAGRIVIDPVTGEIVFEAGPHQEWHGDYDKLCRYFTE